MFTVFFGTIKTNANILLLFNKLNTSNSIDQFAKEKAKKSI